MCMLVRNKAMQCVRKSNAYKVLVKKAKQNQWRVEFWREFEFDVDNTQ
jgi:hypothetical protein